MNQTAQQTKNPSFVIPVSPEEIKLDELLGEGYIAVYEIRSDGDGELMMIASDSFVEDNRDMFINYLKDAKPEQGLQRRFFLVDGSESGDFPSVYDLVDSNGDFVR